MMIELTLRDMKSLIYALVVMTCIACCTTKNSAYVAQPNERNHVIAHPGFDIDSLYNAFLECSKDQGDMGCDSCWQLIMNGKVDDSYWHEHPSILVDYMLHE